jgi:cyclopropane fatty-acyl-phospholipid synthase-like methyltransferase
MGLVSPAHRRLQLKPSNKILELGAGQGRDTIFFVSNGIEVEALGPCNNPYYKHND